MKAHCDAPIVCVSFFLNSNLSIAATNSKSQPIFRCNPAVSKANNSSYFVCTHVQTELYFNKSIANGTVVSHTV